MAIARDTTSSGDNDASASLTFSHTCTGSDLGIFVGVLNGDADTTTGVTYDGTAMTQMVKRTNSGRNYEIWGLLAPSTGANNVVISRSTSTSALLGISVSYTGVDTGQTLPDASAQADISAAASFALNITTAVDNCWALAFFRADNADNNITAGTGEYLVNTRSASGYGETTQKRQALIDTDGAVASAGVETLNASFPANSNGSVVAASFAPDNSVTLSIDAGSYAVTGNALNFKRSLIMIMAAGSYAFTGVAVGLNMVYRMIINTGSYVLTGFDILVNFWTKRTKPSTSFSARSKPSTSYSDRSKPTTNWTNRD
jgi:hypothetical protein